MVCIPVCEEVVSLQRQKFYFFLISSQLLICALNLFDFFVKPKERLERLHGWVSQARVEEIQESLRRGFRKYWTFAGDGLLRGSLLSFCLFSFLFIGRWIIGRWSRSPSSTMQNGSDSTEKKKKKKFWSSSTSQNCTDSGEISIYFKGRRRWIRRWRYNNNNNNNNNELPITFSPAKSSVFENVNAELVSLLYNIFPADRNTQL